MMPVRTSRTPHGEYAHLLELAAEGVLPRGVVQARLAAAARRVAGTYEEDDARRDRWLARAGAHEAVGA